MGYELLNLVTHSIRSSNEIDANDVKFFVPPASEDEPARTDNRIDILVLNGQFAYDTKLSERLTPHAVILQTAQEKPPRKAAIGGVTNEAAEYLAQQLHDNYRLARLTELNLKCNLMTEAGLEKLLNALPPSVVRLNLDFSMNCDASAYKHLAQAMLKNPKLEVSFTCHDFAVEGRRITLMPDMEIPKLTEMILSTPPLPATIEIPNRMLDHKLFDKLVAHYAQCPGRLAFQNADNLHPEIIAQWFKSMRDNDKLSISVESKNFNLDNQPNLSNVCQGIQRMAKQNHINFRSGNQL